MNITNPRKTKIFILAAALVLAAAAGPYANTGDDAVLTGLLETAERENPRLGAAMERAERAGAALAEAASKQGPNFIGGAGALWNKDSPPPAAAKRPRRTNRRSRSPSGFSQIPMSPRWGLRRPFTPEGLSPPRARRPFWLAPRRSPSG